MSSSLAFGADVWSGTGKQYDNHAQLKGEYDLVVTVDETGENLKAIEVRVTANGQIVHEETCAMETDGDAWIKTCPNGEGGGTYFDFGLASEYFQAKSGNSFATQIILDSDSEMRLMRTELKDGAPVHFYVESLKKND